MRKGGRVSSFKPEYVEQAAQLCELGATDEQIARFFKVHRATFYRWQAEHPELSAALKMGKDVPDERVQRSLYHRAVGYTFKSVKIFQYEGQPVVVPYTEHVPPDTVACIFWLKNRRPDEWRDRQQLDLTNSDGSIADMMAAARARNQDRDWLEAPAEQKLVN